MQMMENGQLNGYAQDHIEAMHMLKCAKGALAGLWCLVNGADNLLMDSDTLKGCFWALQGVHDCISEAMQSINQNSST